MSRDYLGSSLIFGVLKKLNIIVPLNSLYVYEFVVKLASMHITSTYFKKKITVSSSQLCLIATRLCWSMDTKMSYKVLIFYPPVTAGVTGRLVCFEVWSKAQAWEKNEV